MQTHVVFGAGQVGHFLSERLAAGGHRVKVVSRSGGGPVAPGIERLPGDARDEGVCVEAVAGATVIYHCMNPQYSVAAWSETLPRIQQNLVAAAGRAGARIVVLENLYPLGRPDGVMSEDTPARPCSRKGEIRARLFDEWFAAHRRGAAQIVMGRGSDFFGPRGTQTFFEERFWKRVLSGKGAQVLVDPDTRHTYHFIPDVAAGLATLGIGTNDDCGKAWMLPCAPAVTTRELIGLMGAALGREVKVQRFPELMFKLLSLFVPILRELDEMRYQWERPFIVDDRRFRERFGVAPTPLPEAARQTVEWAQATYAR